MPIVTCLRPPDVVAGFHENRVTRYTQHDHGWQHHDVNVTVNLAADGSLAVDVRAMHSALERVVLRWRQRLPAGVRVLGDHWERGYGDLEWRGLVGERVLPWYFLAHDGRTTDGCGVKTGAGALCYWTVDSTGVSLWLDLRNGGSGVLLAGRTLRAAEVVCRSGHAAESPFTAARAFCRALCAAPRLPRSTVYGSNNWYYAYGVSSHDAILHDTEILVDAAPTTGPRPYMVIDAGWQARAMDPGTECACGAPWDRGNAKFPDMPGLAAAMHARGAQPGIWVRPLAATPDAPATLLLPLARAVDSSAKVPVYDPSLPEVLATVTADFARCRAWGYTLIKHDWTTCDILGRWGFQFGAQLTNPGWHFADRSRTTAEIITALNAAIRAGAGDAVVIGCNTIGHLGAGYFELQRTGDDTSGREWERTRKMGVNTLAFRMPQHNAFFAVDADCVGLTTEVPWALNRQWLDVLARSGTPLFVSADPKAVGPEQARALRAAFAIAASAPPIAEPLDWLDTTVPSRWRIGGATVVYDWSDAVGSPPA